MSLTLEQFGIDRLDPQQRMELIELIWDTLPAEALPPLSEDWTAEIQRRSAEYDAGRVQIVSWDEIKADARRRVGMAVPDAAD